MVFVPPGGSAVITVTSTSLRAEVRGKWGFPVALVLKDPPARRPKNCRSDPWIRKIPWRREWQPMPGFWPGESHGQSSLVGSLPWGHTEPHTTEVT